MKNSLVKKLFLTSSFLSSFMFPSSSYSQERYPEKNYINPPVREFVENLPEKFHNFWMNDSATIKEDIPYTIGNENFQLVIADLDNDSLPDIFLLYPKKKIDTGKNALIIKSVHPYVYYFLFDGERRILVDDFLDGLNYNEHFPKVRKKSEVKI